jgi:hypothetical protein
MIILSLNLISCCVSWCATSLGYCPALLYALNLQLNDGEQVTSCSLSTHSCLLSSLSCSQSPSLLIFIEHHLLAVNRKTGRTVQTQDLNLLYIRCIPKIFCFLSYNIQHCFICRPSNTTVPTDAGIEPRTVAFGALAVRRSNR